MYYKITDKQSEVYNQFKELLDWEREIKQENERNLIKKAGSDFRAYMGTPAPHHDSRVTRFSGFEFTEPDKLNPKAWKPDKDNPDIMVPNRRTKAGKEMDRFLSGMSGELKQSHFGKIYDILGLSRPTGRFKLPQVGLGKEDEILIAIDAEVEHEDVIETTLTGIKQLKK